MHSLLQPLLIPECPWTDISMDFIKRLPISYGKDVIFVIVDQLSKYSHFIALKHPYTTLEVAQVFIDNVFKLHRLQVIVILFSLAMFLAGAF